MDYKKRQLTWTVAFRRGVARRKGSSNFKQKCFVETAVNSRPKSNRLAVSNQFKKRPEPLQTMTR